MAWTNPYQQYMGLFGAQGPGAVTTQTPTGYITSAPMTAAQQNAASAISSMDDEMWRLFNERAAARTQNLADKGYQMGNRGSWPVQNHPAQPQREQAMTGATPLDQRNAPARWQGNGVYGQPGGDWRTPNGWQGGDTGPGFPVGYQQPQNDPYQAGATGGTPGPIASGVYGNPIPTPLAQIQGGQAGSLAGNTNPVNNVTPQTDPAQGWLTGGAMQGIGAALGPFNSQWYDQLGSNLWNQASTNYLENINPALNSAAIMAGGYGGDRAALAKGVAAGKVADSVNNALAPLYAQGYEQNLNRNLQAGNAALGGVLGLGQLDLNAYNADQNLGLGYYNAETQRNLGQGALGVSQYNADTSRQLGLGGLQNQQYGLDTQRQLGLGGLDLNRYIAENQAQYQAGQLNNPQTTNPWGAGLGALLGLYPMLFGNGG